ncbi:Pkinase-domain-containing protein [Gonapodya prolifera JEL478]|uniref:Pkinase-domain-containing protein n=1 Tax=Gonapodya prolifera (strain JEL478) TaxID=1344416 RepID=A0A139AQ94_GONPJ|nr:Pkinase-domain-containing protein [Gonapodya prolifera JEL478]|eukprot:KXS18906.1 Pkinase-domain-containing protein [Gonapodya prolifera JEL478]
MAAAAVANPVPPKPASSPALSLDQVFSWGKRLGKGSFGEVIVATEKATGNHYAVKMINKTKITSKHDIEALRREVRILKEVNHDNVMRLFNTFESDKNVFLQLEFCAGGDLFSKVVGNGVLLEDDARKYFTQALNGIAHLHSKKIVHRDVKPENLLMSTADSEAIVKVADFGLSNMIQQEDLLSTWCGSPAYMAPELVKSQKYDEKVDMWSMGVVLYVLLSGCYPFWANSSKEIYEQIKDGWFPTPEENFKGVSSDALDLIKKLIVVDPKVRLSAVEALAHPWIKAGNHEDVTAADAVKRVGARSMNRVPPAVGASKTPSNGPSLTQSIGPQRQVGRERVARLREYIKERGYVSA